jgi:hypothetical protein
MPADHTVDLPRCPKTRSGWHVNHVEYGAVTQRELDHLITAVRRT